MRRALTLSIQFVLGADLILGTVRAPWFDALKQRQRPVIIDTDAGSDDLIAIAFLLARDDVSIEAITIGNGLAHVEPGAENVLKLLALAGRNEIPVFVGRGNPMRGHASFPEEWRRISDQLPGVELPATPRKPEPLGAADYLVQRLRDRRRKVRILVLGPLTNLGEALQRAPAGSRAIDDVIIMGGAVDAPGNLGDGGYFKTDNSSAEWNMFIDPLAARIVFSSGARLTLIPLDATRKVPINLAFLQDLVERARTPLGRLVGTILAADRKSIEQGIYYAWDPLAAMVLVQPEVVTTRACAIEIVQASPAEGRTKKISGRRPNASVAFDANPSAFKTTFLQLLAPR